MSSNNLAVSVRNLSKSYTIAHDAVKHSTASEAIIHSIKNRGKRSTRETFWALKDVSFDIEKGDVVGIIGRNGAGKSTLLKILSQITEPTSGEIRLYGRVGSLLEVGTGFHPELTGRENIFLNGAILGMKKSEIARQFDAIVDFAEVEKFLDTPVKRYSSGMYVRLAFAVAAHLNPEILIVDEVLAVGDAEFQKKCLGKMQDVSRQEGKTVLFVSHNIGAVRNLCSSAIWLKNGQLLEIGATDKVASSYLMSNLDQSRGFIELKNEPRSHGWGQRFRITGVSLNDGKPFRHGQTISFSLDFTCAGSMENTVVGLGISTLENVRLVTYESNYPGGYKDFARPTEGRINLSFQCDLDPGRYLVDVGARSGSHSGLDYLPGCATIEVVPGSTTPVDFYEGIGCMRMPASWKWENSPQGLQK